MLSFELDMSAFKRRFIDTTKSRAVDGAKRGLMYMGGFIAKVAKNSIKPAQRHSKLAQSKFVKGLGGEVYSQPGQPPLSKLELLRDNIRYGWEDITRSVVIGPVKFGRGNAPAALELGIPTLIKTGHGAQVKMVMVPMRARPYMHPALAIAMRPENIKRFFDKILSPTGQTVEIAA